MSERFILFGDIAYSKDQNTIETNKNSYLVCKDGFSMGVFDKIPSEYKNFPIKDYTGKLIIPGMVDLHVHAPQYANRGICMDYQLLDWLNLVTFKEEAKFGDLNYAEISYDKFCRDLRKSSTTRAVIFGTIHSETTKLLMDKLDKIGLGAYVGKVNMDRESPDYLIEKTEDVYKDTKQFIEETKDKYELVKPIITPRFVPSCTDKTLEGLGDLAKKYSLPVQSHINENLGEIELVRKLCPSSKNYADVYDRYGLFGNPTKSVMAHCVHSTDEELSLFKNNDVFVAHCPQSNANLRSGVSPVGKLLSLGIKIGLGTDISAGANLDMERAVSDAIHFSKVRWSLCNDNYYPVTFEQAFFLATKGGGEFFGKVGSFEKEYEFDAIVVDDSAFENSADITQRQRLERMIYLYNERKIVQKYVKGKNIL